MIENFFHYTRFESALKIIQSCSLKSTHPRKLNDPFECNPRIKKINDYAPDELDSLCMKNILMNTDLCKQAYKGYESSSRGQTFESYFRRNYAPERLNFQETLGKYFRIISGSEKFNITPMWAHYGGNHEGVVIEFDLRKMPFSGLLRDGESQGLVSVIYSETRAEYCHLTAQLSPNAGYIPIIRTKDLSWAYEHEIRIILPTGMKNAPYQTSQYFQVDEEGNLFLLFPPETIKTIYCGIRMTPAQQDTLRSLARSTTQISEACIKSLKPCWSRYDFIEA